jgi:peptide/nickel transport system substrate-binding protein
MDPGRSTQVLTVNYFYNLYDSLTRWDTALRLQPGLATSWKPLNDTTWEFTLRKGVKFHDGSPRPRRTFGHARADRPARRGDRGFATIESVWKAHHGPRVTKKPDPLLLCAWQMARRFFRPAHHRRGVKELARWPIGRAPIASSNG